MPKSSSTGSKPVVRPTLALLAGLIVLFLVTGVGLLFWGMAEQQRVGAFFCLALVGAIVTFGLLGATGIVKTRNWQVGGSAGVHMVILTTLLRFASDQLHEVKGTVYLDDRPVTKATILLLKSDRADNKKEINPNDNGRFAFTLTEKKKEYEFVVNLPGLGETEPMIRSPSDD